GVAHQRPALDHTAGAAGPRHRGGAVKPRLLDLFCGAGGAARGYQMAGFHVTGVDINPQPRYAGDEFVQGDAMTILQSMVDYPTFSGEMWRPGYFDAIHA